MSDIKYNPDDPQLTAYVLGELSEEERMAVEQQLANCPQSRAVVEELRKTTAELFDALQREPVPTLTPAQRSTIYAAAGEEAASPVVGLIAPHRPLAARTAVLVAGGVTVVAASLLALIVPLASHNVYSTSEQLLARHDAGLNRRWEAAEYLAGEDFSHRFGDTLHLDFDYQDSSGRRSRLGEAGKGRMFATDESAVPSKAASTQMFETQVDGLQRSQEVQGRSASRALVEDAEGRIDSGSVIAGAVVAPSGSGQASDIRAGVDEQLLGESTRGSILNKTPYVGRSATGAYGRDGAVTTLEAAPSSGPASTETLGQMIAGPTPEPAFRRALNRPEVQDGYLNDLPELESASPASPDVRLRGIQGSQPTVGKVLDDVMQIDVAPSTAPNGASTTWSMPAPGTHSGVAGGQPGMSPGDRADPDIYFFGVELQGGATVQLGDGAAPEQPMPAPSGGYGGAALEFDSSKPAPAGPAPALEGDAPLLPLGEVSEESVQPGRPVNAPVDSNADEGKGTVLMATPHIVVQDEVVPEAELRVIQMKRGKVELKELGDLHLLHTLPSPPVTDPAAASKPEADELGRVLESKPVDNLNTVVEDKWGEGVVAEMVDPATFGRTLDIPFRQGSFELGVPNFANMGLELSREEKEVLSEELAREAGQRGYRFIRREALRELPAGAVPVASGFGIGWMVPGTEAYNPIVENDFQPAVTTPFSTFGLDVDTASYANVRRFLNGGQWPPPDAVRLEELINYFDYDDPAPLDEHPLACHVESAACPWNTDHQLVRIGLVGRELDLADRPPTTLVFLIDTSGSMRDENKLPLVKQSLTLLTQNLTENDRIAIVTYANEAQALMGSTPGDRHDEILAVIDSLNANGSTNGEGGLKLAYQVASEHFIDYGTNRVILCTDGDFNVGESEDAPLVQLISEKRKSGVFLSICGFGTGNIKDAKLEQIADKGNGQYHYIDGIAEARKVFLEDLAGMLYTLAKDVKLQVEFNSRKVAAYRLLGYENRLLAKEDFDNDRIDAGDLSAGHTVCALYEVVPVRSRPAEIVPSDDLGAAAESDAADSGPAPTAVVARQIGEALVSQGLDQGLFDIHVKGDVVTVRGMAENRAQADRYLDVIRSVASVRQVRDQLGIRHAAPADAPAADLGENLLIVHLRYKQPRSDESVKLEFPLSATASTTTPSDNLEWSAAVASFGMILRNSKYRGQSSFENVMELAHGAKGRDESGRRREFIDLVLQARSIWRRARGESSPAPPELSSLDSRNRATLGGKYDELLDKLEVRSDLERYGSFHDYGWCQDREYAGRTDLPAGYWVYVYPYWYIWGETVSAADAAAADDVR